MTDFTVARPFSYVAGALIDPDENNPNESTLYDAHNAAFHATTGHGHTGATGDGPQLSLSSSVTGTLPVARGGTNITSYAIGDLIYASGATTLSKLADVAVGNALISGGVGVAPSWGKISLSSHITGALPVANAGTNITSYAVGDILYASNTTVLSKLAAVATGNALISGGVTTAPSWGKIGLTTHVSGTLAVANGGTGVTSSTGSGSVVLSSSPTITGGDFNGNSDFDSGTFYVDGTNNLTFFGHTSSITYSGDTYKRQMSSSTSYFDFKRANISGATGIQDVFYQNSSSPTVGDVPYAAGYVANNSIGSAFTCLQFEVEIEDETDGTEDSTVHFSTYSGGSFITPLSINDAGSTRCRDFFPKTGNSYDLGSASLDWNNIYTVNPVTVTSDKRLKSDILKIEHGLEFIMDLNPVFFKWKNSNKKDFYTKKIKKRDGSFKIVKRFKTVEKNESEKRYHAGFLAQEVEDVLVKHKFDFGLVCHDQETDKYMMRPDELLPVVVKSLQDLCKINSSLSQRIAVLESTQGTAH